MTDTEPGRIAYKIVFFFGLLVTIGAVIFALLSVSVLPRDAGPRVVSLIGGGSAENGGAVLRVGAYTLRANDPLFTDKPEAARRFSDECKRDTSQNLLPVVAEPGGFACIAAGENHVFDNGRLVVEVEQIDVQDIARVTPAGNTSPYALSRTSAQVQKTSSEQFQAVLALILLAIGPGMMIAAGIALIPGRRISSTRSGNVGDRKVREPAEAL